VIPPLAERALLNERPFVPGDRLDVAICNACTGIMVALAVARTAGFAALAATTVTDCWVVTFGAWKRPSGVMLPILADQTTPVLLLFLT